MTHPLFFTFLCLFLATMYYLCTSEMKHILKTYPLSLVCIALVWYLSIWFLPPDRLELPSINFLDKWTHFLMYGGTCSVIWTEYLRSHKVVNWKRLLLWAWFAPTLMGGVIEIVQEQCTVNRRGEWLDFLADTVGCTLAVVFGLMMNYLRKRYGRKS